MLPKGADVVVPVEQAEVHGEGVKILASLSRGRHVIERGEDVSAGEPLVGEGHRLRPPDVGALMDRGSPGCRVPGCRSSVSSPPGMRLSRRTRRRRPDNLGHINRMPSPPTFRRSAASRAATADDEETLFSAAREALSSSDLLLFNGGTSVGTRDVVAPVIERLGRPETIVHGVDIRPGKPTIFAVCGGKPVFGLPGQPVSVLNTFDQFVQPVLRKMLKLTEEDSPLSGPGLRSRSVPGRRPRGPRPRLPARRDGEWWATPILGVSAMITTWSGPRGSPWSLRGLPVYEQGQEVECG